MRAFGLMVTNDNLRVVKDAERIAFFGTPMRDREILVIFPNTGEMRLTWSDQRVAVEGRFIATNNSLQLLMAPAPVPPANYDFTIRCTGSREGDIGLNMFVGTQVNNYTVLIDDRNQVAVVPAVVAEQIRQAERDEILRVTEENRAAVGGVVDQLIEGVIDDVAALNLVAKAGDENE